MWNQQNGRFLLWVDGEDGALLKLEPLIAAAQGPAYTRDPGVGTTVVRFDVDPAVPYVDGTWSTCSRWRGSCRASTTSSMATT